MVEICVGRESYLNSALRRTAPNLDRIKSAIDSLVQWGSKAGHRGSLTVLSTLLNSYHQQDDKFDIVDSNGHCSKFISQCFNPTHARNGCILPPNIVEAMQEKFPSALITNLEGESLPPGYSRTVHYIVKQWTTNAVQHFTSNFFRYQERTIIALLQSLNFKNPKEDCPQAIVWLHATINNIENVKVDYHNNDLDYITNHNDTQSFINHHQSFFSKRPPIRDAKITEDWVKDNKNINYIPLYFVHMLRFLDDLKAKNPHLIIFFLHFRSWPALQ